jgi:AraC-like DNA-binding protein
MFAIRSSHPTMGVVHTIHEPALCLIAQGAKRLSLGSETYEYDASRLLVVAVNLPVASQIVVASHAAPYLSLRINLDRARLQTLVASVFPQGLRAAPTARGVAVGLASVAILDAAVRLVELMASPGDAALIAPLVLDEILIRLLRSPIGERVAQLGLAESRVSQIAQALDWVRANYTQPIRVEDLAALVHMSVSSFHQHFKSITSLSPLQYQKLLRLQEARRLMTTTMLDVGAASRQVGYVSVSQFSREYTRHFGKAPTRDIPRMRADEIPAQT